MDREECWTLRWEQSCTVLKCLTSDNLRAKDSWMVAERLYRH